MLPSKPKPQFLTNEMPNHGAAEKPILVHHTGSLGDTLASVPGLRAIRSAFPRSSIHLLFDVQGDARALATDVIRPLGLADEYIPYDSFKTMPDQLIEYLRLWRKLRERNYSEVISLLPSTRPRISLLRDRIFYGLTGIRKSASFRFIRFPANPQLKEAQRRLLRLSYLGIKPAGTDNYFIELPPGIEERMKLWLQDRRLAPEKPLIAICPGAKTQACIWPLQNFIRLGEKLLREGCEILILGGAEHAPDAERLTSAWGCGLDGVGKFSVFETAAALKLSAFMIGVDTGTTHLAAAAGTRCLALFSQREASPRWEPMGEQHQVIRHDVPCRNCLLPTCNKPDHPCMTGITVETVFAKTLEMLRHDPRANPKRVSLDPITSARDTSGTL